MLVAMKGEVLVGAVCVEMVEGTVWVKCCMSEEVRIAEGALLHGRCDESFGMEDVWMVEEVVGEVICRVLREVSDVAVSCVM